MPLGCLDPIQLWIWMTGIAHLMMDDPMLFDFFDLPYIWCHTKAYFSFGWDLYIFMELHDHLYLWDTHRDDDLFVILSWSPNGASFGPFSQAHTFWYLDVLMLLLLRYAFWYVDSIKLWTWMTTITHLVIDDLVPYDFSTYHTSDAILGHISILVEICRCPLICMIIPIYEMHIELMICFYFTMIP